MTPFFDFNRLAGGIIIIIRCRLLWEGWLSWLVGGIHDFKFDGLWSLPLALHATCNNSPKWGEQFQPALTPYALSSAKSGTFLHLIDATSITPTFVSGHNLRKPDEIWQPSPIRCYCSDFTVSPSTISFELPYYRRPEAITQQSVVKHVRLVIHLQINTVAVTNYATLLCHMHSIRITRSRNYYAVLCSTLVISLFPQTPIFPPGHCKLHDIITYGLS